LLPPTFSLHKEYVDGDRIRLLVAGFSTGGGHRFFARHLAAERKPLKRGSVLEDRVRLELLGRPS